jgi:hypothetical protein
MEQVKTGGNEIFLTIFGRKPKLIRPSKGLMSLRKTSFTHMVFFGLSCFIKLLASMQSVVCVGSRERPYNVQNAATSGYVSHVPVQRMSIMNVHWKRVKLLMCVMLCWMQSLEIRWAALVLCGESFRDRRAFGWRSEKITWQKFGSVKQLWKE